jgi:putative ABC transport system permease protein
MKLAKKLDLDVGSVFQVDSHDFEVRGIFETKTLADTVVALIPIEDARELSGLPEDKLSIIEVRPMRPEDADEIEAFVEGNYDSLSVKYPKELAEEGEQVMNIIRNTTWVVSSIAVIVGGIGIANAMAMSVLERTSEIGLLKATGWRDSDVGYSFILEALEMGAAGGILGVILGVIASKAATWIVPELPIHLAYLTLVESFSFALLLSIMSGVYPAIKAARLSPIVAIKGE